MNIGIYALASGYGKSAIAVIRITKNDVISDLSKFINKKKIIPRQATLIDLYKDEERKKKIDNCILIFFKGQNSYSGVDTVELHVHGSLFVIKEIFNLLDSLGYREALPGEFTKLAVLNGKIDLIQAEAINNLINSDSEKAYENSLKNLGKEFSEKISNYERQILDISSFLEASLEYPEDDFESDENYLNIIFDKFHFLKTDILKILDNSSYGLALHSKNSVVIVGPTNSGKSSLFNCILKEDRSIVSDIHGTTRDYIESELVLGNTNISLYDTAGIRESEDKIEKIGISRIKKLIDEANLIIFLISVDSNIDLKLLDIYKENKEKIIIVLNKIDLLFNKENCEKFFIEKEINNKLIGKLDSEIKNFILQNSSKILPISIELNIGIKELENLIRNKFEYNFDGDIKNNDEDYFFIQTIRQKVILEQVLNYILDAEKNLKENGLYDIAAENLKNAYLKINELTGKDYSEDLFNVIFSKFCLGK